MKMFRNILSLCLVAAFVNVYVSKTVHEVFEHEHTTHACENQDLNHWHQDEVTHLDFICSFNISSSEVTIFQSKGFNGSDFSVDKVSLNHVFSHGNIYLDNRLLRGPPVLNS